jgi:PAS domain S-box-containing protein
MILVVDDDPSLLRLLELRLENNGFKVITAKSAKEAVRFLKAHKIEVVITDLMMPGGDGFEVLAQTSQIDPDLPVIFLTAFASTESAIKALRFGAHDFLQKPFHQGELIAAIRRAINKAKQRKEEKEKERKLQQKIEIQREELKDTKVQLRQEVEKRISYIKSMDFGFLALDSNGRIEQINDQAARFLGLNPKDIGYTGYNIKAVLKGGLAVLFKEIFRSVITQDKPVIVNSFQPVSEQILSLAAYPAKIFNSTSVIIILQDITEKKMLERQLFHAAKLASIGELASGIAHEINNPAGYVLSNLKSVEKYVLKLIQLLEAYEEILKKLETKDPYKIQCQLEIARLRQELKIDFILKDIGKLIADTREGGTRIKNIVQGLRRFARGDEEPIANLDVNQVIRDALRLVHNELKHKAKVITNLKKLPLILGYPGQLTQVVVNLLLNAAHAISNQGEIRINTELKDDEILILIKDNGCGIPERLQERIFEPFVSTKKKEKGSGLGLSIAYGIVKRHGGRITLKSKVNQGSIFTVHLPIGGLMEMPPLNKTRPS